MTTSLVNPSEAPEIVSGGRAHTRRVGAMDALVVVGILLFAASYHFGRTLGRQPFVELTGDAAQIASFAAAWDHPERFENDPFLGVEKHYRIYATVHIPLVRWLATITGDYGSAFISLSGLHVFLQCLGFYVFGRVLLGHRGWAVLLMLTMVITARVNFGTFWGVWKDPLPRVSFQSLLPFVLAAAYYWRAVPRAWPWVMVAAGLLMYVHPVSTPAWGFALWLAFWAYLPKEWRAGRRVGYMLFVAAIFLALCTPFMINYLSVHEHGATGHFEEVMSLMRFVFLREVTDLTLGFKIFFGRRLESWLIPIAIVASGVLLIVRRHDRRSVVFVGLWAAGLVAVGAVLPAVEQAVCRALSMVPPELDLSRNVRYLIPLWLIACFWSLRELGERMPSAARPMPAVAAIGLLLWWGSIHKAPLQALHGAQAWLAGENGDELAAQSDKLATLEAIRQQTAPGASILPTNRFDGLTIRYYALRSAAHCWKDGGFLCYNDHAGGFRWQRIEKRVLAIEACLSAAEQLERYLALADELGVKYLVLASDLSAAARERSGLRVLDQNGSFMLLSTHDTPPVAAARGGHEQHAQ